MAFSTGLSVLTIVAMILGPFRWSATVDAQLAGLTETSKEVKTSVKEVNENVKALNLRIDAILLKGK
jgi:hypothetical protein